MKYITRALWMLTLTAAIALAYGGIVRDQGGNRLLVTTGGTLSVDANATELSSAIPFTYSYAKKHTMAATVDTVVWAGVVETDAVTATADSAYPIGVEAGTDTVFLSSATANSHVINLRLDRPQ